MQLKPRDTQTQVKHFILEEYLKTWGGIIINGLRRSAARARARGRSFELHLVYVDCFAYCGRYLGDRTDLLLGNENVVFGSPIIGIQSLDALKQFGNKAGIKVRTNAVLTEIIPDTYDSLLESLNMAGFGKRVRTTGNLDLLKDGEVVARNTDYLHLLPEILHKEQLLPLPARHIRSNWNSAQIRGGNSTPIPR